jgi:hypothetical protein
MRTYTNIKTPFTKIDAMLNTNGRTPQEAEVARRMAERLMAQHGLNADNYAEAKRKANMEAAFEEMKRRAGNAQAEREAHERARAEAERERKRKAKRTKRASPKAEAKKAAKEAAKREREAKREEAKRAKEAAREQAKRERAAAKDDGRMRIVKVRQAGEKKWSVLKTCAHSELKATLASLRAQGFEAKSEVVK